MSEQQDASPASPPALVEAVARAMSQPLANMYGGCFKPDDRSQRGDCADGDCYCARVGKHCAEAALAVIRAAFDAPTPAAISAAVHAREDTGLTSAAIRAAAKEILGDDKP